MMKVYSLLIIVIAFLLYGIYKQYQVEELKAEVTKLRNENYQYKKHIKDANEKMAALKGRLGYLDVQAASLKSDLIFIKANPGLWSVPETEDYLNQLKTGIAEAQVESE